MLSGSPRSPPHHPGTAGCWADTAPLPLLNAQVVNWAGIVGHRYGVTLVASPGRSPRGAVYWPDTQPETKENKYYFT